MQSIDSISAYQSSLSSDSLPSESPARRKAAGPLALARSLPVLLSFALSLSVLYWLSTRLPAVNSFGPAASEEGASASAQAPQPAELPGSLLDRLPPDSIQPVFTPSVMYWAPQIRAWARSHDLNPNLVATVMQIESCGHPTVRSPSGAIGLFQVMPYHFLAGEAPQDPGTNASRGLAYLAESFSLSAGRLPQTLAGYNGGHGVISRQRSEWPQQTRRYVRWGMGILRDISSGEGSSSTLRQWLNSGGDRLCDQAVRALAHDHPSTGLSVP
jgi:soluble lytic murein transglycosylase-like protein